MDLFMLKSKIHQARITGVDMSYEGSIVIDTELMGEVGLIPYEKVLIANISTGSRFETYVIEGDPGSGTIALNGAAARLGQIGDQIIILSFAQVPAGKARAFTPKTILLDERNRVLRRSFAK
jgi:aspartate 1-decarboxylase